MQYNKQGVYVSMPQCWGEKARVYGVDKAADYARRQTQASLERSGNYPARTSPDKLGHAKAAEAYTAAYFGMNPGVAVDWKIHKGDFGYDLVLDWLSMRGDVKNTAMEWLYWNKPCNHLFWNMREKDFDILISTTRHKDDMSQGWIEGWITKQDFWEQKQEADGDLIGQGLDKGTWFVPKFTLEPIALLLPPRLRTK